MRITDIPLTDIMQKYLSIADFTQDGSSGRWKTTCPFHQDSDPSLILYDKVAEGQGWDYHCFSCGAHGVSTTMLTALNIAQTEEQALDILLRDFDLKMPDHVTLTEFAKFKGLDKIFLEASAWKDTPKGVEIPYFDMKQNLVSTKVRTKYYGKDKYIYKTAGSAAAVHTTPYGLHWLDLYDNSTLYITEGETDCMTLRQAGYQVLGFSSNNGFRPEFSTYLKRFTNIVVVKDNDEPGWRLVTSIAREFPSNLYMITLPKGIKDINNYHLYNCRSDIANFKVMFGTLATLPATPETFISAVKDGLTPTEKACWQMVIRYYRDKADILYFSDRFCAETKVKKTVVTECLKSAKPPETKETDKGEFSIIDNCYYKLLSMGDSGRSVEVKVSNFILIPEYDIRSDDDIIRVVTLTNQYGETAKGVRFTSEDMCANNKFNMKLVGSGNFIFTGDTADLFKLCMMIFERSKKVVHSPKRIGRLDTGGWLFGNCGIDSHGVIHEVKHGVVTLDGKTYAPRSIVIADGENTSNSDLPTFSPKKYRAVASQKYLKDTALSFKGTFGTYGAYLALGWCVAGWFSDQIFDHYGFFPYLFISGKRASGKSVMSNMLQGSFGFSTSSSGMSIETPSNIGILRYLGYRSSLPSWYDDYRCGVKRIQMKDGLLLDVYNRHGSVKGLNNGSGEIRQESVNGFVLLSGEDTPENNALLTRCVVVQLSATERDASLYAEAQRCMEQLSTKALMWAKASTRGADLTSLIDKWTEAIFSKNGDIRYARNYGIFAGCFEWAFGRAIPKKELTAFLTALTDNAYHEKVDIDALHPMAEFFHDFPDMIAKGFIVRDRDFAVVDLKHVAIRVKECHKGWTEYHRGSKMQETTLRSYIKKEAFFMDEIQHPFTSGRYRAIKVNGIKMAEEFEGFIESTVNQGEAY
jgi:hypothetical protein